MGTLEIKPCNFDHVEEYGRIYAEAFSGEPWNDPWRPKDAEVRVRELMESKQFYGLECVEGDRVLGMILGTSSLFHFGRVFEISDLAVDPACQGQGIGTMLLEQCLADVKEKGMVGVHLITAPEGKLPAFYGKYGFTKEDSVILMGREL